MLKHLVLMSCSLILACSTPAPAQAKDNDRPDAVVVDATHYQVAAQVSVTLLVSEGTTGHDDRSGHRDVAPYGPAVMDGNRGRTTLLLEYRSRLVPPR